MGDLLTAYGIAALTVDKRGTGESTGSWNALSHRDWAADVHAQLDWLARQPGINPSRLGIVAGSGRQDSLEFQLLDPMAELTVGDSLVTFGSKGGRPYAPGLPIGEVVEVGGTAGQLTRVATIRPFVDMSSLSVVGVVIRPPRVDPRDSVLPTAPPATSTTPGTAVQPPTLGDTATPSAEPEASPTPTATAAPERETAATLQPDESGAAR